MAWEDQPKYRDRSGASANPLMWLLSGSMPMFTAFGIRVRAHASLLIYIVAVILLGYEQGYPLAYRAFSMALLVSFVILHEFGHCFAARWMGGTANDVLLWPLGGLAYTDPPHRPLAHFVTSSAGPLVNLLLCVAGAVGFYYMTPHALVSFNPLRMGVPNIRGYMIGWSSVAFYFWWVYIVNYVLVLFNLLPIYPLDGGQMVQAALWPMAGYFRSMMIATMVGMIGAAMLGVVALTKGPDGWLFAVFCGWCFFYCYQRRAALRETGPEDWRDSIDYAASIYSHTETGPRRKRIGRSAIRKARRIALHEKAQRDRIDTILAKVSAHGMQSLTWRERRTLRKTTESQRRREHELSHFQ